MNRRRNILLIVSDMHRMDFAGCYGHAGVKTPAMDRLAREGTRVTQCVSPSPVCSPFRATFQTGLYAHQHGVVKNDRTLGTHHTSLADHLNALGYATCFIGKSHWSGEGPVAVEHRMRWQTWLGFGNNHDHYDTPTFDEHGQHTHARLGEHEPTIMTQQATAFMADQRGRPWAMQLNYGPPHNPTPDYEPRNMHDAAERARQINREIGLGLTDAQLKAGFQFLVNFPHYLLDRTVPQRFLEMYGLEDIALHPLVPEVIRLAVQHHTREYAAQITSIDHEIDQLLSHLAKTNQLDDTLILYTSDHGDILGSDFPRSGIRDKCVPMQSAYRVPLIVRHPATIRANYVTDAIVSSVDLLPTIVELAGGSVLSDLPGHSLADHLQRNAPPPRTNALMGCDYGGYWRGLYTDEWFFAVVGREHTKRRVLIHHPTDPHDTINRIDDPSCANIARELESRTREQLIEFKDEAFLSTWPG
jgi:arylsulfatase